MWLQKVILGFEGGFVIERGEKSDANRIKPS